MRTEKDKAWRMNDDWRDANSEYPNITERVLLFGEYFGEYKIVCGYWNGESYNNDLYKTEKGAIAWKRIDPPAFV